MLKTKIGENVTKRNIGFETMSSCTDSKHNVTCRLQCSFRKYVNLLTSGIFSYCDNEKSFLSRGYDVCACNGCL